MQKNEQSLLLIHRENYNVPKGQEQTVHCKIAKLDSNGNFLERAKLIKVGLKKFETIVKDNLETMGYTVEILFHPQGKYSNVVIKDKDVELAAKDAMIKALEAKINSMDAEKVIAKKDAEIKALKEALEASSSRADVTKVESEGNTETEPTGKVVAEKKGKVGRPSKKEE